MHQRVERSQGFLDGRQAVPLVHLVEVDVVGAQATQARLARSDEVMARQPRVVRSGPHGETRLRRQQDVVSPALEDLAKDLLGTTIGVHVGGIDEVDTGLECLVDQASRFTAGHTPEGGGRPCVPEGHRSQSQRGHSEATAAQLSVLHVSSSLLCWSPRRVRQPEDLANASEAPHRAIMPCRPSESPTLRWPAALLEQLESRRHLIHLLAVETAAGRDVPP